MNDRWKQVGRMMAGNEEQSQACHVVVPKKVSKVYELKTQHAKNKDFPLVEKRIQNVKEEKDLLGLSRRF